METIHELTAKGERRPFEEIFRSMVDHAGAKLVYGDPVFLGNKMILPVARIRYGFGGGSGANRDPNSGGGGGGLTARPVGLVEVTESGARFIPIRSSRTIFAALGLGICVGLLIAGPRKRSLPKLRTVSRLVRAARLLM